MPPRRQVHLLVMAKEPVAGRVKTRLQTVYSPAEAATIAAAALADTLDAVRACGAVDRRIVALDGAPGPWLGDGIDVIPQVEGAFGTRLAAAWAAVDGPGLQIGMDTPQASATLLDGCLATLLRPGTDAVLGRATDGGWWAIGFRRAVPGVFDGVPMSCDDTGERQLARMIELGLRVALLPELDDMDRPEDVARVAATHPHLRTAAVARALAAGVGS